jgi:predicted nucleotidyltransferase
MPYLGQVEANILQARRYLADAQQQFGNWPFCGSAIGRALEHGACAVFIAWGEPYKAGRKIHRHFGERLAPCINEAMASFVTSVWEYKGSAQPYNAEQLLAVCRQVIDCFEQMASVPPPESWLAENERSFLVAAAAAAREACPGVRLLLFGSRAAGMARSDSDYDLLFIFPDRFPEAAYGQSVGRVVSLADRLGVEVDDQKIREGQWKEPEAVDQPLVNRIKACSVEVQG